MKKINKQNNKRRNYIWLISTILVVLFFIIFFIFMKIKNNNLTYSDWLGFLGSYLCFAGSVILGYVAVYQNQKLKEDNETQYKNAIKPEINFGFREKHILTVVDMREYFNHIAISENLIIEHTNIIPRDILSLYSEFRKLNDISSDKSISDEEYNRFILRYKNRVEKLSKKYLLIDFYLDNNGNGNAINMSLFLNDNKLNVSPSLQSNQYNAFLFLIEIDKSINIFDLKLDITYENIDNDHFSNHKDIKIVRNSKGQLEIEN